MNPRRKRFGLFDDMFPDFTELEGMMNELVKQLEQGHAPTRPGEPIVYGVNIRIGPEGKPVVEKFGNVDVQERKVTKEREPLVDVIEEEKHVRIIAELPGVADKQKIKLNATPTILEISVDEPSFSKITKLPAEVLSTSAKATYKNGILEVLLQKKNASKPKNKGNAIKVE
ncbi:MAG TPA: archaeal heat shock protein Hsp20 [Candidatus Norongarragalinales archaeon]|jgi:HSP20 family protein|nr:archaeal heat shock protein Hsp20 [Candidatus Norongarragalinales archaeon]